MIKDDIKNAFFNYSDEKLRETLELQRTRLANWPEPPARVGCTRRDFPKEAILLTCRVIEEIFEERTRPVVLQ